MDRVALSKSCQPHGLSLGITRSMAPGALSHQAPPYQSSSSANSKTATGRPCWRSRVSVSTRSVMVAVGQGFAHGVRHFNKGGGVAQTQVALVGQR